MIKEPEIMHIKQKTKKFSGKGALPSLQPQNGGGGGNDCLNLNFRQNFPYVYTWFYKYR